MDEIELLASVFESSLDAKIIFSSKGKVYRSNRAAERLFLGKDGGDLEGSNIFKLFKGKSAKNLKNFLIKLAETKEVHDEVELRINGDSKIFDVTGNASIVKNLNLMILRDITEKARDKRSREQFIAIAGHELKTPLTVISVYTDLLKRRYKDDYSMQIYLEKISDKSKVLLNYIESILDEIKIGAGKLSFEDSPQNFTSIILETVSDLKKAFPKAQINVYGRANKTLNVDRERIAQVVRNLVVNAIRHSPKRKPITVGIKSVNGSVMCSVTDLGRGIAKKEQSLLFNAFYRGTNSKKFKGGGLGLGLYISKQIVKRYGGTIAVESKVGQGTKFYFVLPVK